MLLFIKNIVALYKNVVEIKRLLTKEWVSGNKQRRGQAGGCKYDTGVECKV